MKTVIRVNLANKPEMKTDKKGVSFVSFTAYEDKVKRNADGSFEKIGSTRYFVTAYSEAAKEIAKAFEKGELVELSGSSNSSVNGQYVNHFFRMFDGKSVFKPKSNKANNVVQAA